MLLSFIIPHKGREDLLSQTIISIGHQSTPLTDIEVIIVTQNCQLSREMLPNADGLTITILHRPEHETISALRNIGVTHAAGNYIAFLDADVALSPNWVQEMLKELTSIPTRVLVSAVQNCPDNAPPLERIRTALSNANIDCNVRFLPGRNLLLTKDTFYASGGFPEHLITCEDYYFTDKVHSLGDLYYSSKATYIHLGEDKVYREMFDKEIWRGQSNLQSIKGRPIPLSELPSFLVPIWILLFFIVTVIGLIVLQPNIVTAGLLTTLLPVTIYSTRLYLIAKKEIPFSAIFRFYIIYFPARIIGTLSGLFSELFKTSTKKPSA